MIQRLKITSNIEDGSETPKEMFFEVTPGDLVLASTRYMHKINHVLGIFGKLIKAGEDDYFCFSERPFALRTRVLPSGVAVPEFRPLAEAVSNRGDWEKRIPREKLIHRWPYNYDVSHLIDIAVGKKNIVAKLSEDSIYSLHAQYVERMNFS